jgi:translation initiation factor 1
LESTVAKPKKPKLGNQKITIKARPVKYGVVTEIKIPEKNDDTLKELAKAMKRKLGCGGTVKEGKIILQGNHIGRVKDSLIEEHGIDPSWITPFQF